MEMVLGANEAGCVTTILDDTEVGNPRLVLKVVDHGTKLVVSYLVRCTSSWKLGKSLVSYRRRRSVCFPIFFKSRFEKY
jgi:hypothetical protein